MSKQEILLTESAVDFLKEEIGGGGTTVIANPTLVGDEPDLTGLEVEGIKYKVPEGGSGDLPHLVLTGNSGTITLEEFNKIVEVDESFDLREGAYITLSPYDDDLDDAYEFTCFPYMYLSSGESSGFNFLSVGGEYYIELTPEYDESGNILGINWEVTKHFVGGGVEYVELDGTTGVIENVDDITAIVDHAFIRLNAETILLPTYVENVPQGTIYHYSSAINQNNKYIECVVAVATGGAQASYNVEIKTISSSSLYYAYLKCYDTNGNQHDLTFLCENASISTYDGLAEYLINGGFTEGEISSGQNSNIGLPVTDTGHHPVFSMQASANTSSGVTNYDIYCYGLYISSGEIIRDEIHIDPDNGFWIYHLN